MNNIITYFLKRYIGCRGYFSNTIIGDNIGSLKRMHIRVKNENEKEARSFKPRKCNHLTCKGERSTRYCCVEIPNHGFPIFLMICKIILLRTQVFNVTTTSTASRFYP